MNTKKKTDNEEVRVVFLGAGRPQKGNNHPVLQETAGGSKVLDWLLQAYPGKIKNRQFVGGYRLNELVKNYSGLVFIENPRWESTGATGSLFVAEIPRTGSLVVSYSDILYRPATVQRLLGEEGDIVVAIDSRWKDRYQGRTTEDMKSCEKAHLAGNMVTRLGSELDTEQAEAEFIGLVCFKESALTQLEQARVKGPEWLNKEHLSGLIEWMRLKGLVVRGVDVEGDWAELNDPRDLARFVLGTKAQTLDRLRSLVKQSRIEDQVSFTVDEWREGRDGLTKKIQNLFKGGAVVVRSSALHEDGFSSAKAGVYSSLLDIPTEISTALSEAIDKVAASYLDANGKNQVLVQPMVRDVKAAGVVFTRTLERGAPYYIINYDDSSGSTVSVTGGSGLEQKVLVVRRDCMEDGDAIPACLKGLIPALREIEALVGYDSLDIEFAVNNDRVVHIFQVRPIAVDHDRWKVGDEAIYSLLQQAERRFTSLQKVSPFALGRKALFGIMPDWNPAEIIGTNPGRLSASLYQYLITDEIWATQRAEYGYRDVRPLPLMVSFANRPYVDVRASFNSFIPADLEENLAARLVDFYLGWLEQYPHLHDKVEFEVVPTCFSLDFERWEKRLSQDGGFRGSEIASLREALKEITLRGIARQNRELKSIAKLEERYDQLRIYQTEPLNKAYLLLLDCKKYGTLAFSHLARSAFIAVTLLKSAVSKGIISQASADDFLNSIRTIGHELTQDAARAASGELSYEQFLIKYGHLRPGTYDLTMASYGEEPDRYLRPLTEQQGKASLPPSGSGERWTAEREGFFTALREAGFPFPGEEIECFMRGAIEGREYAKFVFSRNLSAALDCLIAFGETAGLDREELAHLGIEDLFYFRTAGPGSGGDIRNWLQGRAGENADLYRLGAAVELPPLLTKERDFHVFTYPPNRPNFIGSGAVTAQGVDLVRQREEDYDLAEKIAMIPRADPGYDWLFGRQIAGLITMYGGANSHMAIRAAEFGLPAAIGIGEIQYKKLAQASVIELNAEKKWLRVIR